MDSTEHRPDIAGMHNDSALNKICVIAWYRNNNDVSIFNEVPNFNINFDCTTELFVDLDDVPGSCKGSVSSEDRRGYQ